MPGASEAPVEFRPVARRTVVLARTGDGVRSFGPYVAAMREDGAVLFTAEHHDGSTTVRVAFDSDGAPVVVRPPASGKVVSHPDGDADGSLCFYARSPGGATDLWLVRAGDATRLWPSCGPLGPTMDSPGHIAFRTDAPEGQGVRLWDGRSIHQLDQADAQVAGFEGLPVTAGGRVVWRATLRDGSHEIRLWSPDARATIVTTGVEHASLARFPAMDRWGRVVFGATSSTGVDALHVWAAGRTTRVACTGRGQGLESIRGGLISVGGTLVLIATPTGGGLGAFADAEATHPIIQIGGSLDGSTVTEFAVNPVSINARDQIAIRATLADGRQVIARSDPAESVSA